MTKFFYLMSIQPVFTGRQKVTRRMGMGWPCILRGWGSPFPGADHLIFKAGLRQWRLAARGSYWGMWGRSGDKAHHSTFLRSLASGNILTCSSVFPRPHARPILEFQSSFVQVNIIDLGCVSSSVTCLSSLLMMGVGGVQYWYNFYN